MLSSLLANPAPAIAVAAGAVAALVYTTHPSNTNTSPEDQIPRGYVQVDERQTKPGHGPVYRVGTVPTPAYPSMLHSLQAAVEEASSRNFLGHRTYDVNGNALAYVWETYAQVYQRIENLAKGLAHEKMLETTADGDRPLCLYMKNRPEWVMGQYAAMLCGGFGVALYDTLGEAATQFILNQTLSPTVLCTTVEWPTLLALKSGAPTLRHVVLVDVDTIDCTMTSAAAAAGIKLYALAQVESIGATKETLVSTMPSPKDIYALLYTSGTTGSPKGVPITHEMVMTVVLAVTERAAVGKGQEFFSSNALHLSYLPLAHSIEHLLHVVVITNRGAIAYYQGNVLKLVDDLVAIRPTAFVSVPRLLNKMYDKIIGGAHAKGGIQSWLFNLALSTKLANLKRGTRTHAVFDALVFSKIRQKLGLDRACGFISGSAPLSPAVMDFFSIFFYDGPAAEGYGLTETAGVTNIDYYAHTDSGTIGPPLTSTELKLVSVPDMGYNVTDTTHGDDDATRIPVHGRGELCMRGPNVFSGYYKAPEKTAEVVDHDGWFHSGDIAVWTTNGCVKIVDRKKNIFKLSQGEYVSPDKIENALVTNSYVGQIFVYGDSLHSLLVAIVVPDEAAVVELAHSLGVTGSLETLYANKQVTDAVLTSLDALGIERKLYGFERVKAIKLTTNAFSVENDMLTATFKLKRTEAKKAFLNDIADLYEQCGDLIAGQNLRQG
ncbi:Aste57867_13055 [Aphanomyces stellatus]|uniref:Aste57867_13055 protein n=1 Tax=Aphanomyces stellatus TaxID=120398 RepID=A0A485KY21_9STRA|nr:hypothetical protein As57867_013007 [Aphanomyces stellatus]VFT89900.1 Aste57867_13055 [Aphanomyces stellatus]